MFSKPIFALAAGLAAISSVAANTGSGTLFVNLKNNLGSLRTSSVWQQLMMVKIFANVLWLGDAQTPSFKSLFQVISSTSAVAAQPSELAVRTWLKSLKPLELMHSSLFIDNGINKDIVFTGLYDGGAHSENISLNNAAFFLYAPLTVDEISPVVWNIQ